MAKVVKEKTKKPSGLKIVRDGVNFTASWKIGDKDYGEGQSLQYQINNGNWVTVTIGKKDTKKKFLTINFNNYWPVTGTKLTSVTVRVRGRRKNYTETKTQKKHNPKVSDWTNYTYSFAIPKITSLTATPSTAVENECTFTWRTNDSAAEGTKVQRTEFSTCLVPNFNEANVSKAFAQSNKTGLATGNAGATGSRTQTEVLTPTNGISYTRVLAVRAVGCAGNSPWAYTKCVYGIPYFSIIKSAIAKRNTGGYSIDVKWESTQHYARPIEETVVQYAVVTPEAGITCPEGASWTDGATIKDTAGVNSVTFGYDSALDLDKVIFIRVNNKFRSKIAYGIPTLVTGAIGALTPPEIDNITTDDTTYRATITATNNSAVPDSFLVIKYMTTKDPTGQDVGIIPVGHTGTTVQCPNWGTGEDVRFGVYAAVGTYTHKTPQGGPSAYVVNARMRSSVVEQGGIVPAAPQNVSVSQTDIPGTVRVAFAWAWSAATGAEISWADHEDAWESTDEPETYEISTVRASAWNVSGLETGTRWYFRVRLFADSGDSKTYGQYSETLDIDLSSAPAIPALTLSAGVITEQGSVTASWVYVTTDSTGQASAELAEVTTVGGVTTYTPIAYAMTAQHIEINAADMGWTSGEAHALAVRVTSASGRTSDGWSNVVTVNVAEPLTAAITQTSLVEQTIVVDGSARTVQSLTVMPFTATATGAGDNGTTTLMIVRDADYVIDRPDESQFNGFEGETIALWTQTGEAQITINQDDLIGHLDDEAQYRLIATVQDALGQSDEASIAFEVHWTHQAIIPTATVTIDNDEMIAVMRPIAPAGTASGDVCDIYRLSVDKPELIYPNASWGVDYVDPFPTIGEYGGHRFVFKSVNGDYITADNEFAWYDTGGNEDDYLESDYNVIDFGTGRVMLQYNIDLSNSWTKDFKETQYLGGSIQGDWNPAVSRSSSVNAVTVTATDSETIEAMRRLATWPGICHVRTKDGSSYAADVQVSEDYKVSQGHKLASFQLKITRVDQEEYDGMTLAEWEKTHPDEEESEA